MRNQFVLLLKKWCRCPHWHRRTTFTDRADEGVGPTFPPKQPLSAASFLSLLLLLAAAPAPRPLTNVHSHNDYEQPRPLFDALDHGFCSVEADIYLVGGQLLVAHTPIGLRPGRTLESLYLVPLTQRIKENGGRVYRDGPTITLLVDLKTDGPALYAALRPVFQKYADILTRYADGKVEEKAVTIILSGNRPIEMLAAEKERLAFIDGRLPDLESNPPATLTPWISSNFTQSFKWRGQGEMPPEEMDKLRALVSKAHEQHRRIRFWSIPDNPAGWKAMQSAGVDLINSDKLAALREFLDKK
ncbi:MAG: phosphatidylinositol-specific phospholipase C/glycerophosphodiester phosphodiesterase family protein [Tepidisphaerales bacterium]